MLAQSMSGSMSHYPLTENLILQKTKMHNLRYVKKLNVCAAQMDDISILKETPNLEVCSMSVNNIEDLWGFSGQHGLKELYLRKNNISDIRQVLHLAENESLAVINLSDNPICNTQHYRKYVISAVQSLQKLDDEVVSPHERKEAQKMFPGLHLERPPSPEELFSSPPRPENDSFTRNDSFPMRPQSAGNTPNGKMMQQPTAVRRSPPKEAAAAHQQSAAAPHHTDHKQYRQPAHHAAPAFVNPKSTSTRKEDAAVTAVNTLLNEMSPQALMEVSRHLDALLQKH